MLAPALPSIGDLVLIAIEQTDFIGDITADPAGLRIHAAACASSAAEIWEETLGDAAYGIVPAALTGLVGLALVEHAEELERRADRVAADTLADAIAAGDLDRDGRFVSYDFYRGV